MQPSAGLKCDRCPPKYWGTELMLYLQCILNLLCNKGKCLKIILILLIFFLEVEGLYSDWINFDGVKF